MNLAGSIYIHTHIHTCTHTNSNQRKRGHKFERYCVNIWGISEGLKGSDVITFYLKYKI